MHIRIQSIFKNVLHALTHAKNILGVALMSFSLTLLNSAVAQQPYVPPHTDYFDHIALFSQGRITRFTQMPIRVYISPVLKASPYLPEIRYAMQTWHAASDGDVCFEEIDTPQDADIRVSWGYTGFLVDFQDTRLGSAQLTRLKDSVQIGTFSKGFAVGAIRPAEGPENETVHEVRFTVEIILMLEGDGTIGDLSPEEMRTVCLHEFGHAIGLWGHSPHPGDICYPTATAQQPTRRDIATLRKLYNTPLNTPQHDVAISVLKTEIEQKPYADPRIRLRNHYLLGAIYFDKGDISAAIATFQTCKAMNPKFQPAVEKLIQIYHETGETDQAIALVEKRVMQKPSPADYNTLGIFYYDRKDVEKAIQAFEKALHIAPYHKAARRNLHQLLRAKGFKALAAKDFNTATPLFQRVLQMGPLDASTYQLMGNGYAQAGEFETAITYYQKAIDINPVDALTRQNLAQCYNNYGVTLRNRGKWDAAIEAYRHALQLMPTLHLARTNLSDAFSQKAHAHNEAGELAAAVQAYLALQKLHPDEMHIRNLLGELYLKKGDYVEAVSAFQDVYNDNPNAAHALHNLIAAYHHYARSLSDAGNNTTAIEVLEKALQLVPADLDLRMRLANAYQGVGDYKRAALELSHVLARAPASRQAKAEQVNLRIRHGNALMQQRAYAAALAEFEAIPESERDTRIYNTIGYLCLLQGAPQKAFSVFETVLQRDPVNMPAFRNLLSLESQLIRRRSDSTRDDILTRTRCVLAITLIKHKQPITAVEKYRLALTGVKKFGESETLDLLLIETGKQLAHEFQKYGDTENRERVLGWVEERSGR